MPDATKLQPTPHCLAMAPIRLMVGLIFINAGYSKFSSGIGGFEGMLQGLGIPMAGILAPLVATAELAGGLGILVGVLPRFSSAVLALVMVTSTTTVQWPNGGFQGSRLDLLLLASLVSIAWTGAGGLTVPNLIGKPELDIESRFLKPKDK